ncbi:MAG: DUF551 domain-containing protein [Lachnospiraceae bacterium]|nr:DUF551 domain-containing protein [Lachnospiraceae bacterium]
MPKYIDVDALIERVKKNEDLPWNLETDMIVVFASILRHAPAADVEPVRKWIPVMERLPKPYANVILCRPDADGKMVVEQGFYGGTDWWKVHGTRTKKVVAWMPLPEPPEMNGGNEE